MRKFLLLSTMFVATSAMAFSGVFGGGGGGSGRKSSGVDSIGVHVNGKDKANIDIRTCDSETEELVGSECCKKTLIYTDNDTTKCCSTEGYDVQDGKCKKQCGEGLVLNEETNVCEDACPEERQCGDVCCGDYHTCIEGRCCQYDEYCCDSSGRGMDNYEWRCCNADEISYQEWIYADYNEDGEVTDGDSGIQRCCQGTPYYTEYTEEHFENGGYKRIAWAKGCCTGTVSKGTGPNGADECLE